MAQNQVTVLSSFLALNTAICALFQAHSDKRNLLRLLDNVAEDMTTTALYSSMSDADLVQYETFLKGMRRLLK